MRWHNLEEMRVYAQAFVKEREGGAFGLCGDLGAGKTSFVRECVETLAQVAARPVPRVMSPSFVIHQQYDLTKTVDHYDLYRIENASEKDLLEIGYYEALSRSETGNFLFVEWPEKAQSIELLHLDAILTISLEGNCRIVHLQTLSA
ncbi:MAG: tRNA (adenosine(37)-N6)-threonylcarbamoyltransferase complex ATPase subunit type 1 TsaE [Bdellovibrionales bacterium]|nr:tRNA (adenosine(37)-N6)-threonylcarbamoyltransferase complex ATPase subunit type 1 TsaE [Bdellovibrionales bacterium]